MPSQCELPKTCQLTCSSRELVITPQSHTEHYTEEEWGKSNRATGRKHTSVLLLSERPSGKGQRSQQPTAAEPLYSPYKSPSGMPRRDDTWKISAEVRCREDRPVSSNLNKWPRLLWKPQGWKRSTLKTKPSEADFISTLKRFMTRKGKMSVKCFLAKSIVAALEKEAWIRSTHHTSSIPNPRRTVFCTLSILRYENSGFLIPFWHPISV